MRVYSKYGICCPFCKSFITEKQAINLEFEYADDVTEIECKQCEKTIYIKRELISSYQSFKSDPGDF